MSEREGDGAPRRADENPLSRRRAMESRRIRPVVQDAPLPEKVEPSPSRRLNVVKASEVAAPEPAELPPAWLPPRADDPSRRPKPSPPTPSTKMPTTTTPPTRSAPPLKLLAACGAITVVGIVAGVLSALPPSQDAARFDGAQRAALTASWRAAGLTTWGGAVSDPAVVAHIGGVAQRVLGPDSKILVVASKTSAHAFALPDGTIVISAGLLWRLQDDAELAAVLAHTHAHQRAGHLARVLDEVDDDTASRVIGALAAPAAPESKALLVGIAERAGTSAFSVDDEAVADAIAVDVLTGASVGSGALVEVVKRFSSDNRIPWARQHTTVSQRRLRLADLAVDAPPATIPAGNPYALVVLKGLDRARPEPAPEQSDTGAPPEPPEVALPTATTPTTATTATTPATTAPDGAPTVKRKGSGKGAGKSKGKRPARPKGTPERP